jgi:PKD repeat protein
MRTGLAGGAALLAALAVGSVEAGEQAPAGQAGMSRELVHATLPIPLGSEPAAEHVAADVGEQLAAGPDFAVAVPGGAMTSAQLASAATTVRTTISGGFSATIVLSVTGLPAGVSATFAPATIAAPGAGGATLKLVAGAAAPVGTYTLTVKGTAGATIRSTTVSFTVAPYAPTDVTIYTDDFEGAFPGVWFTRHFGANTWWGSSTHREYAGTHSVYCAASGGAAPPAGGPYPANMSGWMAYGPFSLVGATAARASFKYWNKSQLDKDTFQFMMSINGSQWWGFKRSGTSSSVWQSASLDFNDPLLPNSGLGQAAVYFAFIFESDGSTQYEGAYVDSLTITKTVGGTPCVVNCTASVPAWGAPGTPVQLEGTINAASCSGSPTITWGFGDGTAPSTAPSPAHTYAGAGVYPWQMTAAMGGQSCVRNGTVTISSCALACNATAPASANTGASVQFDGQVTPTNCTSAAAIAWTFGDGAVSAAQSPTHTYAGPGVYPWKMTVTADGRTCEKTGNITITDPPICTLSCGATVPAAWSTRTPVPFHASATASNCGASAVYSWDFGDGASAATADAAHTYATLGPRSWTLTVTAGTETCVQTGTVAIQHSVRRHLQPH